MSDKKEQNTQAKSRRHLLKATVAGSGALLAGKTLPEEWARPLVESVTLPAHAQTSLTSVSDAVMGTLDSVDNRNWMLDQLVPTAMAGADVPNPKPSVIEGQACVQDNGDGTVNVQGYFVYSGVEPQYPYCTGTNVPLGVTTSLTIQNVPCLDATMTCSVFVELGGGAASGTFNLTEEHIGEMDTAGQVDFILTQPGCPIELPVVDCDYDADPE